ncbi:putative ribonuclease H-like domain-containing protein, partial [Tanacetum coccineum]
MAGEDEFHDDNPPPPPPVPPTQQAPHTLSTIKLPILKKGEYDIWAMKMEHYLGHTDYPIWEVIQKGNGPVQVSTDTNGQIRVLPPKTAEEILARERERKARTTLLMSIPEDHLAKFHKMTDAKEMWEAIKSRFGGNDESKKMQKYILKQQFESFSVSNSEGLHKGYDRFQSLLSQLEIHGAGVSTEDVNQKFLRSLPASWSQVSLIMRTKPGVDTPSFDDLYNNLRVFESDIKGSTSSSSSTQNVAFVSSKSTNSTNDTIEELTTAGYRVTTAGSRLLLLDTDNDNDSVFRPKSDQTKPKFTKINFVKSGENMKSVNKENTHRQVEYPRKSQSPRDNRRNWNGMMTQKLRNGFEFIKKACFVCGSFNHLIKDCDFHDNKMVEKPMLNNKGMITGQRVNNVTTAGPKAVVSAAEENRENAVKSSACWIWRPTGNVIDHTSKDSGSYMLKIFDYGNPQYTLQDQGIFDSGCSRHMTGNKSFLTDYQEIDDGFVAFEGSPKGGKITRKGKIRTGKLDFEDVYFVKKHKFNLFSVSQMCDKKNSVLFTKTENLVLSPDFKLLDESQVLLKVSRHDNMYSFDLKNVVPSGDLTCLFVKDTIDESNLWHMRLGHINFKTMNKLVRGNLLRGLPSKLFENDHTCVACQKRKQHKASCKTKLVSSINQPLQMLHMDLFGPTFVRSINHKIYCLVVTDDFSRCDNGTEFKNNDMNQFYGMKGIKREFSVAITPQQSGVAERKNRTLIEAVRTMLADSLLPTTFWVESVNTACYVQNRVLVTKPHNKTPYKLLHGSGPDWLFDIDLLTNSMNYKPVTAGNQTNVNAGIKDNVDAVPTEQYILQPLFSNSPQSSENAVADDAGKKTTEEPANKGKRNGQEKEGGASNKEGDQNVQDLRAELDKLLVQQKEGYANSTNRVSTISPSVSAVGQSFINVDDLPTDPLMPDLEDTNDLLNTGIFSGAYDDEDVGAEADLNNLETTMNVSPILTSRIHKDHPKEQIIGNPLLAPQTRRMTKSSQEHAMKVWRLVDLPKGKHAIGTKWVYRNKKDKRGIVVRNKARLVAQGYTQEKGINYDEAFALVFRIEAIRIFLAYASFMGFIVYQMDVKSAFLYGTIEEEVYVDDIIFGSIKKSLYDEFEQMMHKRFQMSSMGEITFFLGLQVKQKDDGIFISQDKYMADILKKFDFVTMKTASILIATNKALLKDEEAEDVDVHLYRSLMYLTAS